MTKPFARVFAGLRDIHHVSPIPRTAFALAVTFGVLGMLSAIGLISTSAWLIARASQMPGISAVGLVVVGVRALGISRGVFRYAERLASHNAALDALAQTRVNLYRRLAGAPLAHVSGIRHGTVIARLGQDTETVGEVLIKGVLPYAVAVVTSVVAVASLAVISAPAALWLLAGLVVATGIAPLVVARGVLISDRRRDAARQVITSTVTETISHRAAWEVSGRIAEQRHALRAAHHEMESASRSGARAHALGAVLIMLGTAVGVIGACASAYTSVDLATATGTEAINPVWYAVAVLVPLAAFEVATALPAAAASVATGIDAAQRLRAAMDAARAPAEVDRSPGETSRLVQPVSLRTSALIAGWTPATQVSVGDLDVEPGTIVLLQGVTGSGKSAVLATLAGLLEPRSGSVRLVGPADDDGGQIASLHPETWRRWCGYVGADDHIFATTVRENVRLLAGDVDDQRVRDALEATGASPWLDNLDRGLDTLLASGGANCSGGERRRLLIARAVAADPRFVFLDEPTEHLDARSSHNLGTFFANWTTIGDRVCVIATHDDILAASVVAAREISNTLRVRSYTISGGCLVSTDTAHTRRA